LLSSRHLGRSDLTLAMPSLHWDDLILCNRAYSSRTEHKHKVRHYQRLATTYNKPTNQPNKQIITTKHPHTHTKQ
jgi:hypothetical protein